MRAAAIQIFKKAKELTPGDDSRGNEWLDALQSDAEAGLNAWVNTLKGYLRGLWAAGIIEIEDIDDFDKILIDAGYKGKNRERFGRPEN